MAVEMNGSSFEATTPVTCRCSNDDDVLQTKEKLSNGIDGPKISHVNTDASPRRRKLVLHFDNRNTLQVSSIAITLHSLPFFLID